MLKRSVLLLAALSAAFFVSCGGTSAEDGTIPSGIEPFLLPASDKAASLGATATVVGGGFSIVPAANVLSIGGASTTAQAYGIGAAGETLAFQVPSSASLGRQTLIVIVDGIASNGLDFTVNP